jgi:putative RNA 2'-phosphotransferase
MNLKNLAKASRFLSLVLRHKPEQIGITLDSNGWTDVHVLLQKMKAFGYHITKSDLITIVEQNDKQRFAFNNIRTEIRASQGHSVNVDLNLSQIIPPQLLFHGTAKQFVGSIFKYGIVKGKRQHVHLSHTIETAKKVGSRHGEPVIFKIYARKMYDDGYKFYQSDNGVWLTDVVPVDYFEIMLQS